MQDCWKEHLSTKFAKQKLSKVFPKSIAKTNKRNPNKKHTMKIRGKENTPPWGGAFEEFNPEVIIQRTHPNIFVEAHTNPMDQRAPTMIDGRVVPQTVLMATPPTPSEFRRNSTPKTMNTWNAAEFTVRREGFF